MIINRFIFRANSPFSGVFCNFQNEPLFCIYPEYGRQKDQRFDA